MNLNRQHKPGCLANVSCLVIHPDGICPGPYGKCTCDEGELKLNRDVIINHGKHCRCDNCKEFYKTDPERWEDKLRKEWGQEYHRPEGFIVAPEQANMHTDRIADWWLSKLHQVEEKAREDEHKFFLNILDGIDMADQDMGNKGGGTRAIRHALKSRVIKLSQSE